MEPIRRPFQGVGNILRFNWHYYVILLVMIILLLYLSVFIGGVIQLVFLVFVIASLISVITSLTVSYIVYDRSELYEMNFLNEQFLPDNPVVVNVHAGFDESSEIIKLKFPRCKLFVLDFYDPSKHTEVSIKRARKVYPPFPDTQRIDTQKINLEDSSVDLVVLFLSAHEIRDDEERINFFKELNRILKQNGKIFVTEHIRDTANFLAYNIGAFHFHPVQVWMKTFDRSGFKIMKKFKTTPFITNFILIKNGNSS